MSGVKDLLFFLTSDCNFKHNLIKNLKLRINLYLLY